MSAETFPTYGESELGSWTVVNHEAEFGPFRTRAEAVEFMEAPGHDKPYWDPFAVNETDLPNFFNTGRPGGNW